MHLQRIRKYQAVPGTARPASPGGGTHPFFEVLIVTAGEVMLEWLNERYPAGAGALFLLPPDTPHRLTPLSPETGYWYAELECAGDASGQDADDGRSTVLGAEELAQWNRLQCARPATSLPGLEQSAERLMRCLAGTDGMDEQERELRLQLALIEIRALLLRIKLCLRQESGAPRSGRASGKAASGGELAERAMRILESEYNRDMSLSLLADRIHVNPSHLIRVFKRQTGRTPFAYLSELRLSAAKSLLLQTKLQVQAIAEATGFPDIHHFSRKFKRRFGASPSVWRQRRLEPENASEGAVPHDIAIDAASSIPCES